MNDGLGYNSLVSTPGYTHESAENTHGANAPLGGMQTTHGVLTVIITAAVALVALRILFNPSTK